MIGLPPDVSASLKVLADYCQSNETCQHCHMIYICDCLNRGQSIFAAYDLYAEDGK